MDYERHKILGILRPITVHADEHWQTTLFQLSRQIQLQATFMHRYVLATAILVCAAIAVSDAFAQRGGRGGTPQMEGENGQRAGPGMGRSRGGRPGGGQRAEGGAGGRSGRGGGAGGADGALFAALDADSDGVITRAEMQAAMRAFAQLDKDNDGKLSKEETGAAGGGMAGRGVGAGGRSGTGGGRGGRGNMQGQEGADGTSGKASRGRPEQGKSPSPFGDK